jgi:hypothetical protein
MITDGMRVKLKSKTWGDGWGKLHPGETESENAKRPGWYQCEMDVPEGTLGTVEMGKDRIHVWWDPFESFAWLRYPGADRGKEGRRQYEKVYTYFPPESFLDECEVIG